MSQECTVHFAALCMFAVDADYLSVFNVRQMLGGSLVSCPAVGKKPCTAPLT